jgi:hypothetical protein
MYLLLKTLSFALFSFTLGAFACVHKLFFWLSARERKSVKKTALGPISNFTKLIDLINR